MFDASLKSNEVGDFVCNLVCGWVGEEMEWNQSTIFQDTLMCPWLTLESIQPRPLDLIIVDCGCLVELHFQSSRRYQK